MALKRVIVISIGRKVLDTNDRVYFRIGREL
jgi:hypothetical protein